MKKIWMDFNEPDPTKMRLLDSEIKYFDLKIGERIILYTEDIQEEAIVRFHEITNSWYGEVVSECITVSNEIAEAREDGFLNGKHFGTWTERHNIIRSMYEQGISKELIMQVTKISEIELKRLIK
jgi:hypothetical protein